MDTKSTSKTAVDMLTLDVLYHTALLQVAQRIQARRFFFRAICVTKRDGSHYRMADAWETPRTRATYRLRALLLELLSENITPATILEKIDQKGVAKCVRLDFESLRILIIQAGILIADHKQRELAQSLIDNGVEEGIAQGIAKLIITRRSEVIRLLNETDDTGADVPALPAPSP